VIRKNRSRAAFTLVELLVVLAIIAVLAALTSAAVQRVRINQNVRNSEDVVVKLQEAVDTQVKTINEQIVADRRNRTAEFQAVVPFCDNDDDRAAALLTYIRVRQYLPFLLTDSPTGTLPAPFNSNAFNRSPAFASLNGISASPSADGASAAFLYVALSQRAQKGNAFDSDAATSGMQSDLSPADNPQLVSIPCRVYKDAWGNPVCYRLVSSMTLPELGAAPYTKTAAETDPFDPLRKLANWTNAANKNAAQTALGVTFDGRNKQFIVYSAGQNRTYENLLGDDILGHRLRSIGARGGK
jgi:prepilin-type N-terminal cleavage/methylation domain-containing protein